MLEDLGCSEVLLSAAADGSQQACFSIPVEADLGPAQRLIDCLQQQQHQQQQQERQPFMLHVAFRVGRGVSSHAAPELQLQYPHWAEQQLPPLSLPSWDPQTSLVEYVPHLAERLNKHLQDSCPAAVLRFDLVKALAGVFGHPLEVKMQGSSAVKGSAAAGSSSFAGTSSSMGRAKTSSSSSSSSSSAVFQLQFDQQPLLLFVEMPPSFPAEAPLLLLQSMRRMGPDSCAALSNIPWSPRWDAAEMAARLFNFVKQQAPGILKDMEGGSSGAAL
ncbi:hypothetical protein OEZ86_004841 [Tetradesmus obliquus]|nr:hypothetical protein OEZ86_004841 [Tetradesmus obliquus]